MVMSTPAFAADGSTPVVPAASATTVDEPGRTDDLQVITISHAAAPHVYRFATVAPAGGRLAPVQPGAGKEITSEVLVQDANGTALGAYDTPWALDADGRFVPTSFRIEGTTLVQTVTIGADTRYPVLLTSPLYSLIGAAGTEPGFTAMAAMATVPSDYVYDPRMGTLHDYCTRSPDTYLKADFRGPCARHDLCYQAPGNNKSSCDDTLYAELRQNCDYAYGPLNPIRVTCYGQAKTYHIAVTQFGDDPLSLHLVGADHPGPPIHNGAHAPFRRGGV